MPTLKIHGIPVTVSEPYAAGHVLNEHEAEALNDARARAVVNNNRPTIAQMLEEAAGDVEKIRKAVEKMIAEYDAEYTFEKRRQRGQSSAMSPVEKEARRIARQLLSAKLAEAGITQKEYKERHGENALKEKVEEWSKLPAIIARAEKVVAEKEKAENELGEIAI